MDEDETTTGPFGHALDLGSCRLEGSNGRTDRHTAVSGDLGCDEPDAQDVGLTVCTAEPKPLGQVMAHDVAIEGRDGALAMFEDVVDQSSGQGGLARTGQTREEDNNALPVARRASLIDDGGDAHRQVTVRFVRQDQHLRCVGACHAGEEPLVRRAPQAVRPGAAVVCGRGRHHFGVRKKG
ncbi:MAG: hypothetical protein WKF82_07725 [Nocardioidaceae bacterium]